MDSIKWLLIAIGSFMVWSLLGSKAKVCSVLPQTDDTPKPVPYECDVFAYSDIAVSVMDSVKCDPSLILAIIWHETKGKPTKTWEDKVKEYSYGVMQILGSTARNLGFEGPLDNLMEAHTNIYYGGKYLAYLWGIYHNVNDVIAAYNHGEANRTNTGYVNQTYVDSVNSVLQRFRTLLLNKPMDTILKIWI